MIDALTFVLQLGLTLAAVLLAAWLAARWSTRRMEKLVQVERQAAEESRRQIQAELIASLPPIPPEMEQLAEIERWLLTAHDLQLLLTSLGTLIRIKLRADEPSQSVIYAEIDRSLKLLARHEKKWLNCTLPVMAYVRQLDPAVGKAAEQTLEREITRLNQAYVQAAQSLRRAACLCEACGAEAFNAALINTYLTEGDQSAGQMSNVVGAALDRPARLKQQLPGSQVEHITATTSAPSVATPAAQRPPRS
jgi:hypothetical protein